MIEESEGENSFGTYSNYGMEFILNRYLNGFFSMDAHEFYQNNRLYFGLFCRENEDLKKVHNRFCVELKSNEAFKKKYRK